MRRLARNSVAATATTKTNNHEETLLDPPTIPPTNDPSRIATEGPYLHDGIASDEFRRIEVLREIRVHERPEEGGLHAEAGREPQTTPARFRRRGRCPQAPATPTSPSFTVRMSFEFSCLSASVPAVAEKRMNGRMNSPAAKLTSMPALPEPIKAPKVR